MNGHGPPSEIPPDDALRVFAQLDPPCTPLTTADVASDLECHHRTAEEKLAKLADSGELYCRNLDVDVRVWWRPASGEPAERSADAKRSELEQFGAFVKSVEDYAIFMLDPDGVVTSWNEGARRMKGYTTEEIQGEHFSIFYTDTDVERGVPGRNLERARTEGHAEDEGWRVRGDGSRFWASVVITAVHDDDGTLLGYAKITRDLTDRRDRERRRYETILEAMGDPVYELDARGRYVFVNDAFVELTGYSREEIVGEHVSKVLPAEEVERGTALIRNLLRDPDPPTATWEYIRITASGERVPSENHVSLLPPDERGRFTGTVGVVRDISARKERERQLEQRRIELETELGEILGRVSDAFYAIDAEWQFSHVNERAEELLEHSQEDLLGVRLWEAFPEATETVLWEKYHVAMENQEPVDFVFFYEPLDGWFEVNAYPSETGLSVYFRDVTERVERERDLELYEQIVETVSDGVYALDDEHRFVLVNEAFCTLLGYEQDDILGRNPAFINGAAVTEADKLQEEIIAGDRKVGVLELDIERTDGQTVPVEVRFGPYEYGPGRYGRCGVVRDVTERRQHERALSESERRFRTVFEEAFDAILLADDSGRYLEANPAATDLLGVDREALLGRSISDILPDDYDFETVWASFLDEGELQGIVTLVRSDGEERITEFNAKANVLPGRHLSILRDVTERTEYQHRLEEAIEKLKVSNERLEQYAYVSSHDLQEPLRTISNFLELLEGRYRDALDDDAREFIAFAVDATDRMRAMINDLLRYSRVESEATPLEPTDCNPIIDRVLAQIRLQIEENDAEVVVEDLPTIVADENQLEQVFQNLVSNAIKYRRDELPRIEITAETVAEEWIFHVTDNGIGIDPDRADRVFEVFKRLHTQDTYSGTGIGLALCKRIVQRHGGRIWVDSEPGVGSTFSFAIPIVNE